MLNTPSFWYHQTEPKDIFLKNVLTPLSWVYEWLVKKRFDLYLPVPMEKPVICVGNLVVGGAGKTPTVLSLADVLKDMGYNPHLLTRGYGGVEEGPMQVNADTDSADDVGDEAMLLARKAPAWVAVNRPLGAQSAMDSGANVVVMDDGFQNPVIYKDFSFIVVDGQVGFGNKHLLPSGPLREPIEHGLARANALVIIGEDKARVEEKVSALSDIPVLHARVIPDADSIKVADKKVVAFAGIARPNKFKDTLEESGAEIIRWQGFADHYPYKKEDIGPLVKFAEENDAEIMTTSKDLVRVPQEYRDKVKDFPVTLVWDDKEKVSSLLMAALEKRQ